MNTIVKLNLIKDDLPVPAVPAVATLAINYQASKTSNMFKAVINPIIYYSS